MSEIIWVDIDDVIPNPKNPRIKNKAKYKKLLESLKKFPEMLEKRPLVCVTKGEKYMSLGGNMRREGLAELGKKKVPIMLADDWSEEQRKEFIIKDNVSYGDWDFEALLADWDISTLKDWGVEGKFGEEDDLYSRKIESPHYEPTGYKPELMQLIDTTKVEELLKEINRAKIPEEEKEFLRMAAYRHTVFNYSKIADYYAHSNKKVQKLMESSALVIIDFNKAIAGGFVQLTRNLMDIQENE